MSEYIIIGGHGKVAMRTAPLLVEEGHKVTSVIRNPDQAQEVRAAGANPLVLDIEHATQDDLVSAFRGKDGVIWAAGAGGGNPDRTYAVDRDASKRAIDAAAKIGVPRYVMISYQGAKLDHGVPEDDRFYPYAQSKAEADAYLNGSTLDFTILGPGMLTLEEPTHAVKVLGTGEQPETMDTSRANVAHVIVAALNGQSAVRKTLNFVDGDIDRGDTDIGEAFHAV